MSNQTLVSNQTLSPNLCFLWDDKLHYLSLNGMCIWRPALAAFLLASPIAAAASAAAAAADGLRVSLVCEGEPPWCEFGFTLPGLKWAARASTSRIVAFKFPSTISKKRKNYFQDFEGKTWSDWHRDSNPAFLTLTIWKNHIIKILMCLFLKLHKIILKLNWFNNLVQPTCWPHDS